MVAAVEAGVVAEAVSAEGAVLVDLAEAVRAVVARAAAGRR